MALASFVTLDLLRRLHEGVVMSIRSKTANVAKHKLLGAAMLLATGVPVPPDHRDIDKIGNHLDVWLRHQLVDKDRKLLRRKVSYAREVSRAALRADCCRITSWGGVERYIFAFDELASSGSQDNRSMTKTAPPYVPYTTPYATGVLPPYTGLLELKEELNRVRDEAGSAAARHEREKQRAQNAKRRWEETCIKQAVAAAKIERLRATTSEVQTKLIQTERLMAQERQAAATQLMRLGSQAARASN
ncbi:hypothetical protein AB1Y20_017449 [Prymnesium parvum]|uniref:Uncharacterized protein n=1 Tax=Prymnesium parvum TaxID=97485 RepID=A0AB34JM89_PRYPA